MTTRLAALLVLLPLCAWAQPARTITVGRGPSLGLSGGEEFYEELQDWSLEDVRAVDPTGDAVAYQDGDDASRDLIAFYSRRENGALYLRFDALDLGFGAEGRALNFGVLLDLAPGGQSYLPDFLGLKTAHPWELALLVYETGEYAVYDPRWNVVSSKQVDPALFKGAYFRSDLDGCETGIDLAALRQAGWNGASEIKMQAFSWKDGVGQVADAVGEASLADGRLDTQLRESSRAGTAKYSIILHGNQSIGDASWIAHLIKNDHLLTPSGRPTGYHRALETHETFGAKVNLHLSGSLLSGLAWARSPDPELDGPAFLRRMGRFVDGDPTNGEGAFVGGVFSEHILPYFEGSGVTPASTRFMDKALRDLYGISRPKVFWSPERVIRGTTFADVLASGYDWTVVDQINHIESWYGASEAYSKRGFKINRINGVNCFVINDDPDQKKFGNTDGGTYYDTRVQLVAKALDPDQEQLTLVFDDWEAYAGRSFTSFGTGNDNPDNYDRHVRWLANHPWVQIVTLDEVASWGWAPVDRGQRANLELQTYHWLMHATEESYDNWYFGSGQEEGFRDLRPTLRQGQDASKIFGEVGTPGTVLHDVWADVQRAPAGNLKGLAELTYSCMVFETAWHDEDMNDYHARDANGDYLYPDTTVDRISNWAIGLHGHVREASVLAHAAAWAAGNPSGVRAYARDVDQDGEQEYVLENALVQAVFEDDGGRLVGLFVRDPSAREGFQVVGAFPVNPGDSRESEWEGESHGAQRRVSGLKDYWSTGRSTSGYVNDRYSAQALSEGWRLTSSDGRVEKTVSLRPGSNRLEVRYRTDPSVGTLYVRAGLSPHVSDLVTHGQDHLRASRSGNRFTLTNDTGSRQVWIGVDAHHAGLNEAPWDGSQVSPRTVALTHQVELSGQGDFSFAIEAGTR